MTLDRTIPPAFKAIETIPLPRVQSERLANGVRLHWLHAGEQPVIRIEVICQAGNWHEPRKGVSFFAVKMLNEGTATQTARQINEYIDQFGAFIEFNHGADRINLTIYTVAKHLPTLLPVLRDIMREPTFPLPELENVKNITAQNLRVNLQKTAYAAQVRFKELLFGAAHPYGKSLYEDDIRTISRDDLLPFYEQYVRLQPWDVVVSGYVDETTLSAIRQTFRDIPFADHVPASTETVLVTQGSLAEVVERTDSVQSSIRLGRRLFTRNHPDYVPMLVLNEVLGGYFGSRLMKNIREEKGFTYGISSNMISHQRDGYFVIGTDVKKEFTEQTLAEIHKEMNNLRRELVGEEELQIVKNYMIGSFAGSLNTPFALADHFKTIYFDGLSYEFYERYPEKILHTSAEDLIHLANNYLNPESMTEVVVGGK